MGVEPTRIEDAIQLMRTGWQCRLHGEFDAAETDITEACEILAEENESVYRVEALRMLGHVYLDQGLWDAAQDTFRIAVEECRSLESHSMMAHCLRHLADTYHASGNHKAALDHYHEAHGLMREANESNITRANLLRSMALTQEAADDCDEALSLWREALDLYAQSDLTEGVEECEDHLKRLSPD